MLSWILLVVTLTVSAVAIITIDNHDRQSWNRIRSFLERYDVGREFLKRHTLEKSVINTINDYAQLAADHECQLRRRDAEIERLNSRNAELIRDNRLASELNASLTTENLKLATNLAEANHRLQAWQDWADDWPGGPAKGPSKDAILACSIPEEH